MIEFRYLVVAGNQKELKLQWRFTCRVYTHMSGSIHARALQHGESMPAWNDVPTVNYIATEQPAPEIKGVCKHVWKSTEHCWLECEICGACREV